VELRWVDLLVVDERDPQPDLHEDRQLHDRGEPPQGAGAQRREPVGGERPDAGQAVADDDEPRPTLVEVEQQESEQLSPPRR
jgi:hypothetical protein